MYSILYTREAKAFIDALSADRKRQIKEDVEKIAHAPQAGKRLSHELTGLYSYRSGDYRIIYQIERKRIVIIILAIGHRKNIYERLLRKFK